MENAPSFPFMERLGNMTFSNQITLTQKTNLPQNQLYPAELGHPKHTMILIFTIIIKILRACSLPRPINLFTFTLDPMCQMTVQMKMKMMLDSDLWTLVMWMEFRLRLTKQQIHNIVALV